MQLMSIWNTWIMILNIKVCVCTGIQYWYSRMKLLKKNLFYADFHVSVNMYRCVWAERNGSGAVCLWPGVIWALNIRASVIRFLSKCGKVQLRRVCELGRTMFNRFSFMFLSVDRVTGDGLVSKSCLCTPRSSDWRCSTGSRSCLFVLYWPALHDCRETHSFITLHTKHLTSAKQRVS